MSRTVRDFGTLRNGDGAGTWLVEIFDERRCGEAAVGELLKVVERGRTKVAADFSFIEQSRELFTSRDPRRRGAPKALTGGMKPSRAIG